MDYNDCPREESHEIKAGLISKLFFFWLGPLLRKGRSKNLDLSDVYTIPTEDVSEKLGDYFEGKWKEEVLLSRNRKGSPHPKLWRVVVAFMWWDYACIGVFYVFDELILRVLQPIFLKQFINSFSDSHNHNQFLLATALGLCVILHAITYQTILTECLHIGMKVRIGISSLIFRKLLRLRLADSEQRNVGKLCNLLSSDVTRFDIGFQFLHSFYIAPLQLIIFSYLLWHELGPSSLGGVGCILILLPVQVFVAKYAYFFRTKIAKRSDERAGFLHEIIRGIRLIKMYVWEKPFTLAMSKLRNEEIKYVRRSLYLRGLYHCVFAVSHKLIPFCTLILYITFGNKLGADKAFFTVSIFSIMQKMLNRVPIGASMLGDMMASMKRIEGFLLSKERRPIRLQNDGANGIEHHFVVMENYSACWNGEKRILKNLNVKLGGDQLVIVVGSVGCGKTSFLNAILSELTATKGSCRVKGRITYASQDPWIFPGTIRENILFGLEMDSKRYWKTIEMCCLMDDISHFPEGDRTSIGTDSLSGGQKARVNLARALYQEGNIFLFDDPLSAVDMKVGGAIFNMCIREHLKGKLRILVTHQLQYLPMADHIIVLNREGEISCQGTYAELQKSNLDLSSLVGDHDQFIKPNSVSDTLGQVKNSEIRAEKHEMEKKTIISKRNEHETKTGSGSASGSVKLGTYFDYFKLGGSYVMITLILFTFFSSYWIDFAIDYFLSTWTNSSTKNNYFAKVYCLLIFTFFISNIFRTIFFFRYCMRISVNLHWRMFSSVVRTPLKFFENNPSGRIMNRFTSDLNQIDDGLPIALNDFLSLLLRLLGMVIINGIANYHTLVPSFILVICLWKIRKLYIATARNLKRLEALTKSPMFTLVMTTASVQGLTTIRALRAEDRVLSRFHGIQDTHTSVFYLLLAVNRWLAITLEVISSLYFAFVCFAFYFLSGGSGTVGLALATILTMSGAVHSVVRQSTDTETFMTSVERAFEYCILSPEAPLQMPDDKISWPEFGSIEFQNVSLAYDDLHENKVLKNINFAIKAGTKVGIVGRSGSGKTSLITALFRLTEPCEGVIKIDGVPVNYIGLHTLRSKISIIPQDPVLFTGTLRYNLDPLKEFQDDDLWKVLKDVDLHHVIEDLNDHVTEGGMNLSMGQRQLLCLARAALKENKILILDEPFANVDSKTDELVQRAIRSKFKDCTILTIAHRLDSVLDSDQILVVGEGRIVEFDTPENLLKDKGNSFYAMFHHHHHHRQPTTNKLN